jgi:hypothetical protein
VPRSRRTTITYLAAALLGLTIPVAVVIGQLGPEPGPPQVADHAAHPTPGQTTVPPRSTPVATPSHGDSPSPGEILDEAGIIADEVVRAATATSTPQPAATATDPGSIATATHPPSHGEATPSTSPDPTHAGHPSPSAPAVVGAGNPIDCSGYPEPRTFLEVQDWWMQTPGGDGTDFGHVHVGTCFPYGQTLAGPVDFDVRVIMHENPGTLRRVDVAIHTGGDGEGVIVGVPFDATCAGTCTFWGKARLDTAAAGSDGWQEFRFKARVDVPDGSRMVTSTGWAANLANGNPVGNWRSGSNLTGRGWYTDFGYQNADIDAIPTAAVSGVWRPTIRLGPGSGGTPTTRHVVAVDPDHHAGQEGLVLADGPGEFRGTIEIDTRRLANGSHRLMLRTDSALDNGSTHSGLLVIRFLVSN